MPSLSRLVRHRVISPSAAARGLGTFDPIPACEALQSLVRVVRPGCQYLDGGGVHSLFATRRPRSSARGEAGFSVRMKRTTGLEPATLGLGSRRRRPVGSLTLLAPADSKPNASRGFLLVPSFRVIRT